MIGRDFLEFDLRLALNILKEEHIIDEITMWELEKCVEIRCFENLFLALAKYGFSLDWILRIDIERIYDIIYKEKITVGDYRVVKAKTASRIRSLIGKWNPPANGQMKISDVIRDIFEKVSARAPGETYYYTGRSKEKAAKGKYAYKLIVCEGIAIFVDLNRHIAYRILTDSMV